MSDAAPPVVRIRSGRPTPKELAAVLVALAAVSRASSTAARSRRAASAGSAAGGREATGWGGPRHGLRAPLTPGDGAWQRASGGLR